MTHTQVQRVIIKDQRATGVQIRSKNGSVSELSTRREVILSAGSFHSPQILQLSGVGAKDELKRHGIETKLDLPGVGQNLQDHLFYFVSAHTHDKVGFNHNSTLLNQVKDIFGYLGFIAFSVHSGCASDSAQLLERRRGLTTIDQGRSYRHGDYGAGCI